MAVQTLKQQHSFLSVINMFALAAYPILDLYLSVGLGLSYANIIGLIIFLMSFVSGKLSFKALPLSYYIYWVWGAVQIYFIVGLGGWSDYLPGGVEFTIFSLVLMGFCVNFNMKRLYQFMKIVFIFATILFLYQYVYFLFTKEKISMFLPLGYMTTYGQLTYNELVKIHCTYQGAAIERFCSIFSEPSHFAQYSLLLLAIELFIGENKKKLYTKFAVFISIVLLLIQSGAGLVGLGALGIIKLIHLVKTTNNRRYYAYIAIIIPVVLFLVIQFLNSGSGEYVSSRTEELDSTGDNSSARLFFGWLIFLDSDIQTMLLGNSRTVLMDGWDKGGFFNGVTYVLVLKGIIGMALLLWFYISTCRKSEFEFIALAIIFLVISLIGATYCTALMLIVTVAITGNNYIHKNKCKTLRP